MSDPKSRLIISCPPEVLTLVQNFHEHADDYKSGKYNETQLRQQFLNPMFEALGWDLANKSNTAEAYKDVVHEDAIKIGQETKAPDYCFRIGGTRKFFLEAKKPSVYIKEEIAPAFQLRRYAWSAKLPLSILCDFEEFAVYDTRIKPDKNDKASTARILYLTYKDYSEKWHELASVFSKEAVLKGSFDKYAESTRLKKGTATVDDAFLTEIEDWRDLLARNIAIRNPDLSQRELNFAVQRTIDRIVFLRICEDRGIENYGRLQALQNGTNSYKRLVQLFSQADDRYNSGLFHFQKEKGRHEEPDTLTTKIEIDDKPLKEILKRLYYPESPYEFSVLSADILGQVYEQFLGKVIRLTAGHQAKVEEKPEVRKAGGVYYTPKYIVDYIVKNTVGQLLNPPLEKGGKGGFEASDVNPPQSPFVKGGSSITPKEASKFRILDPACGSGSFLLGAYQYLLDWHRDWYAENDPKKWAAGKNPPLYQVQGGDYRLTTAERKRILLNNIYGVDIDSQAVEVTKLSLLLKVLEGENSQTLQSTFIHERALPDLGDNIKCGNSLIGSDFYQQQTMLDDEERYRVNVFDWEKEFPLIFTPSPRAGEGRGEGGFDAVIGNPPYIRIQRIPEEEAKYLFQTYESPTSKMDLSLVFLEKGLQLARAAGRVSFICTSQWLAAEYGKNLRKALSDGRLHKLVDFGSLPVFADASTYPAVLVLSPSPVSSLTLKRITSETELNLRGIEAAPEVQVPLESLGEAAWTFGSLNIQSTANRANAQCIPLSDFGKAYIGTKCGLNEAFVLTRSDARALGIEKGIIIPYAYRGAEVERYLPVEPDSVIIYPYYPRADGTAELIPEAELKKKYPRAYAHLASFKTGLRNRQDSRKYYAKGADWYRHLRAGSFNYIRPTKLALKGIARRCSVGFLDKDTAFDGARCPCVILEDLGGYSQKYFIGLLNSNLATVHLKAVCPPKLNGYIEFTARGVSNFPVRVIDFTSSDDKASHDKMVSLVDQMLSLNKQLPDAKTDHEKTAFKRQIDATDQQIDQLVFELYGLTKEEIKLVDENG